MSSSSISAAPRVLVLGANGRFGTVATQAFADAGWDVLAQARRAPVRLPANARHVAIDLADTAALAAEARGACAVIHAVNPPYTRWAQALLPLARLGMDLAERLGALFMLPGNVYNFGAGMPARLREDTPRQPTSRKGHLRCQLEDEMQLRADQGRLRSVVIRAGDFFGGGPGTWFDRVIVKSINQGKLVYPGPLDRVHAWTWLPDLAQAFVLAARPAAGEPAMRVWHHPSHDLTGAELLTTIERIAQAQAQAQGRVSGKPLRHAGLPWWLLRTGGALVPMWRELAEMAYLWEVPHTLDGSALDAHLGPLPRTTLDAAISIALAR